MTTSIAVIGGPRSDIEPMLSVVGNLALDRSLRVHLLPPRWPQYGQVSIRHVAASEDDLAVIALAIEGCLRPGGGQAGCSRHESGQLDQPVLDAVLRLQPDLVLLGADPGGASSLALAQLALSATGAVLVRRGRWRWPPRRVLLVVTEELFSDRAVRSAVKAIDSFSGGLAERALYVLHLPDRESWRIEPRLQTARLRSLVQAERAGGEGVRVTRNRGWLDDSRFDLVALLRGDPDHSGGYSWLRVLNSSQAPVLLLPRAA